MNTWAIPAPIAPPPITVTCLIASLLADVPKLLLMMRDANAMIDRRFYCSSVEKGWVESLRNLKKSIG